MWVVIRILQKQLQSSLTRKTWSWRSGWRHCHVNMWLSTMPCNWRQEILRHSIRNREYCAIPWYCKLVLPSAKLTTTKSLDIAHVPLLVQTSEPVFSSTRWKLYIQLLRNEPRNVIIHVRQGSGFIPILKSKYGNWNIDSRLSKHH